MSVDSLDPYQVLTALIGETHDDFQEFDASAFIASHDGDQSDAMDIETIAGLFTESDLDFSIFGEPDIDLEIVDVGANPVDGLVEVETVDVVGETDMVCAISLDDMASSSVVRMPCAHLYHSHCIDKWLAKRKSCPMCRSLLP